MDGEALDRDTSCATRKEKKWIVICPQMSSFVLIFKVLTEFQVTEVIGRHLCRNTDHNIWETKRRDPEGRIYIFLFRDDLENYTSFCCKNLLCWQIFVKMWVQLLSFILADIQSKIHLHKTNANLPFHSQVQYRISVYASL